MKTESGKVLTGNERMWRALDSYMDQLVIESYRWPDEEARDELWLKEKKLRRFIREHFDSSRARKRTTQYGQDIFNNALS